MKNFLHQAKCIFNLICGDLYCHFLRGQDLRQFLSRLDLFILIKIHPTTPLSPSSSSSIKISPKNKSEVLREWTEHLRKPSSTSTQWLISSTQNYDGWKKWLYLGFGCLLYISQICQKYFLVMEVFHVSFWSARCCLLSWTTHLT